MMRQFYQRFYPHRLLFQWLNQGVTPSTNFTHREFAFTLESGGYIRYQSFPNAEAFKEKLILLNPSRFEIGPVYTEDPQKRNMVKKEAFKPLRKELVFDIDLTDYDDVRTCCSDKKICQKCWKFVTVAIKVVDTALRKDFGFKHILWVYSGRRGAHAWVCDKRALALDDRRRKAIVEYALYTKKGSTHSGYAGSVTKSGVLHPHLERSINILSSYFVEMLDEQDQWRVPENVDSLLTKLYDRVLVSKLREVWGNGDSNLSRDEDINGKNLSQRRWESIDTLATRYKDVNAKAIVNIKKDIMLSSLYPRLDSEVSKHLNHLLKAPFCVHPSTGRICVPIDLHNLDDFDPLNVPVLNSLFTELDNYAKNESQDKESGDESQNPSKKQRITDAERTSLGPYIKVFRNFTNELVNEALHEKRQRDESAPSYDF